LVQANIPVESIKEHIQQRLKDYIHARGLYDIDCEPKDLYQHTDTIPRSFYDSLEGVREELASDSVSLSPPAVANAEETEREGASGLVLQGIIASATKTLTTALKTINSNGNGKGIQDLINVMSGLLENDLLPDVRDAGAVIKEAYSTSVANSII